MATKSLGRVSIVPQGDYDENHVYKRLDLVKDDGKTYLSLKEDNINVLSDADSWMLLTESGRFEDLTPEQLDTLLQPLNEATEAANEAAEAANKATENALTGISGEATEANSPELTGYHRYIVTTPITAGSTWGIAVTQAELDDNWVFFNVKDGVITKETKPNLKGADGKATEQWTAKTFAADSNVYHSGKIWNNPTSASATDVPGVSDVWKLVVGVFGFDDILEFNDITAPYTQFIDLTGNFGHYPLFRRTDLTPVSLGTVIAYIGATSNSTLGIAGYDENSVFVEALFQSETYTQERITITNPSVKFISFSSDSSVDYSFQIAKTINLVLSEFETKLDSQTKIVALSRYDFPEGKNMHLYHHQFKSSQDSRFRAFGDHNFNGLYVTEHTINSYSTSPTDAVAAMKFQLIEKGEVVNEKDVQIRAVSSSGGDGRTINIVIAGDSLVSTRETAPECYRLLNADGDYVINQLGVYTVNMDGVDYKEEGRGGWEWLDYINPDTGTVPKGGKLNPFITGGQIDFQAYATNQGATDIDIFMMNLGTNDVNQGYAIIDNAQLNQIVDRAKVFIDAFLTQMPNGYFVVGLPSIGGDYGSGNQNVENFRNLIQKLNALYIESFDNGAYSPRVHCVQYAINTAEAYNAFMQSKDAYISGLETRVFYDNIHPLTPAYKNMGRLLYAKVRGLLQDYF